MAVSGLLVLIQTRTYTAKNQLGQSRIQLITPQTQTGLSHIKGNPANYTYGHAASLPANANDLANYYTPTQVTNVNTPANSTDVNDISNDVYRIHQFNQKFSSQTTISVSWTGKAGQAASGRNIVLQIWNTNSSAWETLATDSTTAAGATSNLTGSITTSIANYYDSQNYVTCRVYQ